MKNFKNVFRTKGNNRGLFLQLSVFALLSMMTLFSGQTLAQQNVCTPSTTVTEGDLAPGGIVSFGVTSGAGSVTVDHVNAGTGLQSFMLVVSSNVVVNIPAFTPGTTTPVTATFTVIDPTLPVDFTLRAASTFHAAFIRARCPATPRLTVTDDPSLFPGGPAAFEAITAEPTTITVDPINSGTGLRVFSVVSATNVEITIPAFTPGTFLPVTATFRVINPNLPVNFTLRASNLFHGVIINPVILSCTPTITITCATPLSCFSSLVTSSVNLNTSGEVINGSVLVDSANFGVGLRELSIVSQTNVMINIPPFPPGTFNPVVVSFTVINPSLPWCFRLKAGNISQASFIDYCCP